MSNVGKPQTRHYIERGEEKTILALAAKVVQETSHFDAFLRKKALFRTTRCKNPRKIYTRRLCWEDLPELLSLSHLGYRDIIEAILAESGEDQQIRWATDVQSRMCNICDRFLSKRERLQMIEFVKSVTSEAFRASVEADWSPAVKLFRYTSWKEVRRGYTKEQIKTIGWERKYLQRFSPAAQSLISFSKLPMMACMFGVSIHWILGLSESECILAENGETETIMDYFCLLPDEVQKAIVSGLERHFGMEER